MSIMIVKTIAFYRPVAEQLPCVEPRPRITACFPVASMSSLIFSDDKVVSTSTVSTPISTATDVIPAIEHYLA